MSLEKINLTQDSGVVKEIINLATEDSPFPSSGQEVFVLYEGKLNNGKVFDSSLDKANPFKFQLGKGHVIKGWDIGIASMKKGEKAVLYLKSEYAYGEAGAGNDIPPNSDLIFTVELVDFKDKVKSKYEMNKDEKVKEAHRLKGEGNVYFKESKFDEANGKYESAAEYLKEEIKDLNDEEVQLYLTTLINSSICLNKTGNYLKAIKNSDSVIKIKILPKAVYQRAIAYLNNASDEESLELANQDLELYISLTSKEDQGVIYLNELKNEKLRKIKASKKSLSKGLFSGLYEDIKMPEPEKNIVLLDKPTEGNPIVYFNIKAGNKEIKRIEFELFKNITPKTAENFRVLCTGENGYGYKGSIFHRIIKGFMMQGGDFENSNGTGGKSIYGNKFDDENFSIKHTKEGLLSMANSGKNTNGSQFFITFKETPWLDGKHVVFGRVIKGIEHIMEFENIKTDSGDKPAEDVVVVECGEINN